MPSLRELKGGYYVEKTAWYSLKESCGKGDDVSTDDDDVPGLILQFIHPTTIKMASSEVDTVVLLRSCSDESSRMFSAPAHSRASTSQKEAIGGG